jgi:hypothetical protein
VLFESRAVRALIAIFHCLTALVPDTLYSRAHVGPGGVNTKSPINREEKRRYCDMKTRRIGTKFTD